MITLHKKHAIDPSSVSFGAYRGWRQQSQIVETSGEITPTLQFSHRTWTNYKIHHGENQEDKVSHCLLGVVAGNFEGGNVSRAVLIIGSYGRCQKAGVPGIFPLGGLNLPMWRLKDDYQPTMNTKNLQKKFLTFRPGLA